MPRAWKFVSSPAVEDLAHVLTATRPDWENVRGGSLFITGGTGFFGRWLLETFTHANRELALGAKALVLSRNPEAFRATAPHLDEGVGIAYVQGDVRHYTAQQIETQIPAGWPRRGHFVIHAATEASAKLNHENPLLMVDTIVEGTRATLDFAVATGSRRFLLTSSGAVYGAQPPDLTHIPEDYSGAPNCTLPGSAYGEGKRIAELLCACYGKQHGLECLIARCFAFVGPYLPLDTHFAIGNFIRDAVDDGTIKVNGDGTPYRSYLYAADLAVWLWTILFRGIPLRPYNVGSDDDRPLGAIATVVRDVLRPDGAVSIAQQAPAGQRASRYVPDVRRARDQLGLTAQIPLDVAVKKTFQSIRA